MEYLRSVVHYCTLDVIIRKLYYIHIKSNLYIGNIRCMTAQITHPNFLTFFRRKIIAFKYEATPLYGTCQSIVPIITRIESSHKHHRLLSERETFLEKNMFLNQICI